MSRSAVALLGAAGLLIACLGQRPSSDRAVRLSSEPSVELAPVSAAPARTAPAVVTTAPTTQTSAMPSPQPSCAMPPSIGSERVLLRSSGSGTGYELELQSPRGLSPRGLPLWLRLGALELRVARESPTVGEYGAVFQLSRSEFESVPDGAELVVVSSRSGNGRHLGSLDKSAMCIR